MAKRNFLKIDFYDTEPEELGQIVNSQKDLLFKEAVVGIECAIRRNDNKATVCHINDPSVKVIIEKENWSNTLSSSLGYYESVDEFEKCITINKLLNKLHNEPRSGSLRPTKVST